MIYSAGVYHLLALLCTLVVETGGMALWARLAHSTLWRAILYAIVVNLVVHTLFWYSQPLFSPVWPWGLYAAEFIVVLVEGALYARLLQLSGYTPWLLSAALNTVSFLIGLALWQLLG